ncbi:hypothetical protein Rhe02_50170 [Rhizocola hellebori]|uniref:Excreted virulence factor EspC (Type VII ESX diderm) n=1 Tax=Rhizocola hellebori TaxID=1392758 RepID=A0A8J3QCA1_9ACTN|nr:hypothetical protein [Rhizocola hellebori]GIH06950.1 hypothetical protein Rhe02_50170 [Rhizocola hellebori]
MTSDEINLDPGRAASAGHLLSDSGSAFSRVLETAAAPIEEAANGKPWGTDALGTAFATDYLEPAAQLLEVWKTAADRTTQLGQDIVTAVDATVYTDVTAAHRLSTISEPA